MLVPVNTTPRKHTYTHTLFSCGRNDQPIHTCTRHFAMHPWRSETHVREQQNNPAAALRSVPLPITPPASSATALSWRSNIQLLQTVPLKYCSQSLGAGIVPNTIVGDRWTAALPQSQLPTAYTRVLQQCTPTRTLQQHCFIAALFPHWCLCCSTASAPSPSTPSVLSSSVNVLLDSGLSPA
jgi:hypothetical protein